VTSGQLRYPNNEVRWSALTRELGGSISTAPTAGNSFFIKPRHAVTALFKGRQKILERLSEYFVDRGNGGHPRREFLLHGMGGSGKSQIALRFAEQCEGR
jgi:hypothetical protein